MTTAIAKYDMTFLVLSRFPWAADQAVHDILWNHTPWPFTKDLSLYERALDTLKATWDAGERPCDWCGKPATDKWLCDDCREALAPEKHPDNV